VWAERSFFVAVVKQCGKQTNHSDMKGY